MEILYTKTLQSRIEELESERDEWVVNLTSEEKKTISSAWDKPFEELTPEELIEEWSYSSDGEDYKNLINLKDSILLSEWNSGISLIKEDNMEEFAKQEAQGYGVDIHEWPANHINWRKAADELKNDYTEVEYDMETYYYRS